MSSPAPHHPLRRIRRIFSLRTGRAAQGVSREAHLLADGVCHTSALSPEEHRQLERDLTDLGASAAMCAAELDPPVAVAIAVAQEAVMEADEQRQSPTRKTPIVTRLSNVFVSVVSSPLSAAKAAMAVLADLEQAGRRWQAAGRPAKNSRRQHRDAA